MQLVAERAQQRALAGAGRPQKQRDASGEQRARDARQNRQRALGRRAQARGLQQRLCGREGACGCVCERVECTGVRGRRRQVPTTRLVVVRQNKKPRRVRAHARAHMHTHTHKRTSAAFRYAPVTVGTARRPMRMRADAETPTKSSRTPAGTRPTLRGWLCDGPGRRGPRRPLQSRRLAVVWQ